MKIKLFIILLFLFGVVYGQPQVIKLTSYATDLTNTIPQSRLNQLNRELRKVEEATSNQIVFLMIPTLDGYPIENYAYEIAEKNKIGTKENSNGVLFLVVKNDRKMRIEVGYGLEGALPDALAGSIIRNEVAPFFRKGKYYQGVVSGLNAIISATMGEYTAKKKMKRKKDNGLPLGSIIFFIILILLFGRGRGGGLGNMILLGTILGSGRDNDSGFGGGSFGGGGFGGFSGGGGSFGGGGASGDW